MQAIFGVLGKKSIDLENKRNLAQRRQEVQFLLFCLFIPLGPKRRLGTSTTYLLNLSLDAGQSGLKPSPLNGNKSMLQAVQLSEAEKSRLERILSVQNLERQKRIAYPLWAVALIIFFVSQVYLFADPMLGITLLPVSLALLMVGIARFGNYKLFRLLHHQNNIIEQLRQLDLS